MLLNVALGEPLAMLGVGDSFSSYNIVGTPGRLVDLLETGKLVVHRVRSLVLDEADALVSGGNHKEVMKIWEAVKGSLFLAPALLTTHYLRSSWLFFVLLRATGSSANGELHSLLRFAKYTAC